MKKIPQDIIGDIAILKFPRKTLLIIKKLKAKKFLKTNKNVKTVLEKTSKTKGRLRKQETKYLAGKKTKTANYKENNCIFKFNVEETYFSPRLSNERKMIAEEVLKIIKKDKSLSPVTSNVGAGVSEANGANTRNSKRPRNGETWKNKKFNILILFAGISPYPIVLAKLLKSKNIHFHIYSNELNKKANESAKENIKLNKLENYITLIPGDAKKIPEITTKEKLFAKKKLAEKVTRGKTEGFSDEMGGGERQTWINNKATTGRQEIPKKFDTIIMPRPNLKETFLPPTLKLAKKGTTIFYHGFGTKEKVLKEIKNSVGNKIKNLKIRKAGDIAPRIFRWQVEFQVK
ncbi:MAG: hypothetical protein ABIF88_01585 [archaeon]